MHHQDTDHEHTPWITKLALTLLLYLFTFAQFPLRGGAWFRLVGISRDTGHLALSIWSRHSHRITRTWLVLEWPHKPTVLVMEPEPMRWSCFGGDDLGRGCWWWFSEPTSLDLRAHSTNAAENPRIQK